MTREQFLRQWIAETNVAIDKCVAAYPEDEPSFARAMTLRSFRKRRDQLQKELNELLDGESKCP